MTEKVICSYTRQQAIEDGLLVDVSNTEEAKEAGFKIPIALTVGVHSLVAVPKGLEGIQDFKGRLWDTLHMAVTAFRAWKKYHEDNDDGRLLPFKVIYLKTSKTHKVYTLWLVFNKHEGFTIMKPEEY